MNIRNALILFVSLWCGTIANAQEANATSQQEAQPEKHYKPLPLSPEKLARRTTDHMDSLLKLTEKQYGKLYQLHLKNERQRMDNTAGNRPPHMGNRFGNGPGGRPEFGGNPPARDNGMNPERSGNRPPEGFGQHPPRELPPPPSDAMKEMEKQRKKEEKRRKKMEKKIRKILTEEQYLLWKEEQGDAPIR